MKKFHGRVTSSKWFQEQLLGAILRAKSCTAETISDKKRIQNSALRRGDWNNDGDIGTKCSEAHAVHGMAHLFRRVFLTEIGGDQAHKQNFMTIDFLVCMRDPRRRKAQGNITTNSSNQRERDSRFVNE